VSAGAHQAGGDDNVATDVLIVGAGPIGLALAADLGSRGVDCVVLEKHLESQTIHPKIMNVGVRTMEYCRRLGVAKHVREWGFPADYPQDTAFVTSMSGHEIARIPAPSLRDSVELAESPEQNTHCPQNWFDGFMLDRARSFASVRFRYGHELLGFEDGVDEVAATALDRETEKVRSFTAQYLVGCDGFQSTVRKQLAIPMTGRGKVDYSMNILFRSDRLRTSHAFSDALRFVLIGPEGTWATLWSVDGRDLWRLTVYGTDAQSIEAADPHDAMARLQLPGLTYDIDSVSHWTRRAVTAEHMQQGRVFLAGDSAHVTPPNGGLGMNTGFADAMNLGWKLAGVTHGWADPALLTTFEPERLPVAVRSVQEALEDYERLTVGTTVEGLDRDEPRGQALRQALGDHLIAENVKAWRPLGIHLGYVYRSAAILPDGGPSPDTVDDYRATTAPGARAPHAWIADDRSTLDLFGGGFTLMRLGADAPAVDVLVQAAAARRVPLSVEHVVDGEIAALYERRLVLVRPDGHVAWRGDDLPRDAEALIDAVRGSWSSSAAPADLTESQPA
jgi:2-polyprenyl-6-methoxyphenol hydroxylase-like FAD-dependent oxidoreductase